MQDEGILDSSKTSLRLDAFVCYFLSVKDEIFNKFSVLNLLGCYLWCYCDRKSRAVCAQSFAPWQQATIEIMLAISLRVH